MGLGGFTKEVATKSGNSDKSRMILKADAKLISYTLSAKTGTTLFRPWRDSVIENNTIVNLPERGGENDEDMLPTWFASDVICVQSGTDFKFDCVASCSDPEAWAGSSPINIFHDAAKKVAKVNPELSQLLFPPYNKGSTTFPGLTVKPVGFIKGMMYQFDGKECKASVNGRDVVQPRCPILLILPISAAKRLYKMSSTRQKDGTWALEDVSGWYNGRLLEFGFEDQLNEGEDLDITKAVVAKTSGDKGPRIYSVKVRPEYDAHVRFTDPNAILPYHEINQPIPEALNFMTGQEQIEACICPGFCSLKDLVISALAPYNCLPADFVNSRVSVDMGANGAGALPGIGGLGGVGGGLGGLSAGGGLNLNAGAGLAGLNAGGGLRATGSLQTTSTLSMPGAPTTLGGLPGAPVTSTLGGSGVGALSAASVAAQLSNGSPSALGGLNIPGQGTPPTGALGGNTPASLLGGTNLGADLDAKLGGMGIPF